MHDLEIAREINDLNKIVYSTLNYFNHMKYSYHIGAKDNFKHTSYNGYHKSVSLPL